MKFEWRHALNWKIILLRILINGFSLAIIALLLPNIAINRENLLMNLLILGVALGVLNALVKPIIQFLTLSLIFVSYGIVVVIINAAILAILSWLFPDLIQIDRILAAFLGGAIIGLLSLFLEYTLGISPPIVDDAVLEPMEAENGD
jgi:putative membrane protein